MASGLLLSACSVFGIRQVEEAPYQVVGHAGPVEIRRYGPRLAAETVVEGDEISARSTGFRRVAGYIFGGNTKQESIAMTAPVAQSTAASAASQTIAMTAPVAQARAPDGAWRISFFMPAQYTRETLPIPNDKRVEIVDVPGSTFAVLRYSGIPWASAVHSADERLLKALDGTPWRVSGPAVGWFYDPPWTIPPLRRNEAAVPVAGP